MERESDNTPKWLDFYPKQYDIHDEVINVVAEEVDIETYTLNPELGRGLQATILVKWTNQLYHDENLRAMFTPSWDPVSGISKANAYRHRNQYYDGLIVKTSLDSDHIDADGADSVEHAVQPTGVARREDGLTAFACGDKIFLSATGKFSDSFKTIEHEDFARLHSVEFNQGGDKLLTSSSALDLVFELDLDGNIVWKFDAWKNTPYNANTLGQTFFRSVEDVESGDVLLNPDPIELKEKTDMRGISCVIDDPKKYVSLGLPTNLTPAFINGASYGEGDDILVTTFHNGEAWIINRAGHDVAIVASEMGSPHGFNVFPGNGYVVTDTKAEKLRLLDTSLGSQKVIDFSNLKDRKPGLENAKWLQYTTQLDDNLFCSVMATRQRLVFFNPATKERREVSFDENWGIQLVKALEVTKSKESVINLGSVAVQHDLNTQVPYLGNFNMH